MLLVRSSQHGVLTVLRVDSAVLDLPGVVVSDQNAASKYVRFAPAPQGLAIVDADYTFAEYWTHQDDYIEYLRHKSRMMAEVLVPNSVHPEYLIGGYVVSADARDKALAAAPGLQFEINKHLFFQ
jgi:ssDNA thymidine ADP-ribosyltransferase, DarT